MSQDRIVTAHIEETGASAFAVSVEVSGHRFTGDEPVAEGGGNLGLAPYDLLTAALGECTCMTVRWYARKYQWPLDKVEVRVTFHQEGKSNSFDKHIVLYGDQLTPEQKAKLVEVAAKCPVQRTLESTIVIRTT